MESEPSIPLCNLTVGQRAKVTALTCAGTVRRRMLDLGLILDTVVEALQRSPFGDPTAYCIRGAVIALRAQEANEVLVQPTN